MIVVQGEVERRHSKRAELIGRDAEGDEGQVGRCEFTAEIGEPLHGFEIGTHRLDFAREPDRIAKARSDDEAGPKRHRDLGEPARCDPSQIKRIAAAHANHEPRTHRVQRHPLGGYSRGIEAQ